MSCQKEELAEPPLRESGKEATITFTLQPDQTDVVEMNSKALNPEREKYLRNAEIFCYDNKTDRCTWVWASGTNTVKLNLTEGSWDIYVLGNHEDRLETMPRSELERITKEITSEADLEKYSCLPMRGKITLEVTGNMRVPIVLTRIVAKIEVSTTVSAAVSAEIRLQSIQLVNAPSSCTYFKTNSPTSGMISYSERVCTNGTATSFYMLENCQGTNNDISDQKYKGRENAPKNSTYLHIKAETNDKQLDYYIYLGANNTTDFNVSGNKNYVITVNIQGVNDADWRVDATTLTLSPFNDSYYLGDIASSTLKLSCTESRDNKYWIAYERVEGDGTLLMDDAIVSWGLFYPFMNNGVSEKNAELKYIQSSVSKVKIIATVKDANDFTFSKTLSTNYIKAANPFVIDPIMTTESKGGREAIIQFKATKKNYNGAVEMKYEILSGAGSVLYFDQQMENNQYVTSSFDIITLKFFTSEPTNAKIKITFKIEDGETTSIEIPIMVLKTEILGLAEGYRAGGKIVYYVDGVENGTLPLNSCEYLELKKICFYRHMTYPYQVQHESETAVETERTRPNYKLTSDFEYFDSNEEDGVFTCYCHGYTYMFRTTQVEFSVRNPNKFFNFRFSYD